MKREILAKKNTDKDEVAILEDGVLVEYHHRHTGELVRGTVIVGKVMDYTPSLDAYFIDIGAGTNGFLPGRFVDKRTASGNIMLLQVVRAAVGDKGMTLSSIISISGTYSVISSDMRKHRVSGKIKDRDERERLSNIIRDHRPENAGIIIRTNARHVVESEIIEDIETVHGQYNKIISSSGKPGDIIYMPLTVIEESMRTFDPLNDIVYLDDMDLFNKYFSSYAEPGKPSPVKYYDKDYDMYDFFSVSNKIRSAMRRKVWLKSGGSLVFDYTEAMCVIDVNTSKNTGSGNFSDTALRTNTEAAAEIAVQIRLRNIGGIIVIDFIDMDKTSNSELDKIFRKHLQKDDHKMTVGGFTALGNYEITRIRKGKRLHIYER